MAKGLDDLTHAMLYKQSCKEISKIDEIGKKAVENKHVRAYAIVFHNIADANLREGKKPEDGYNFWSERVSRKVARKANKK